MLAVQSIVALTPAAGSPPGRGVGGAHRPPHRSGAAHGPRHRLHQAPRQVQVGVCSRVVQPRQRICGAGRQGHRAHRFVGILVRPVQPLRASCAARSAAGASCAARGHKNGVFRMCMHTCKHAGVQAYSTCLDVMRTRWPWCWVTSWRTCWHAITRCAILSA